MTSMQKMLIASVLVVAANGVSSAPLPAQTLICTTITKTTTEYLSNGGRIIDSHSYTVCHPVVT